jgi:molybdate transport system substrate-binding protein
LTVFAAASLSDALKEIAAVYEKHSGDKVVFNFGASSILARQIQEGAPADVFFSADEAKMDGLEKRGLILKETRRSRLSNSLVIVVAADSALRVASAHDLAGRTVNRIALADPKAVPAGLYARAYLEKTGLWPAVERKIIPTENVRAALAAVESGNVDAGIVYKSDARVSRKVRVACEVKPEEGPPISYPMAVVKESSRIEAGKKFLQHLDSVEAEKIFEKYGFIVRQQR